MQRPGRWLTLLAVLLMALGVAVAVEVPADQPQTIRILSYNIHHGEGVDGKLDLPRIARVILSAKPDLVALQEVDKSTQRTGQVDQPQELARLTGMQVVFGSNLRLQGGDYGNAVLSRFPIRRQENHHLPSLNSGEQRGVLEVEVAWPGDTQPLLFLATHLDHRRPDQERLASVKFINERIGKAGTRPALLAGDLNAVPESAVLTNLMQQWTRSNEKVHPTIPVEKPSRQIDYVLFRPAGRWRTVETRVLEEAVASDHRPVLAVLELRPGPAQP